jgi:hypothetical protein
MRIRRTAELKNGLSPACGPKPFALRPKAAFWRRVGGRRPEGFGPEGGGPRHFALFSLSLVVLFTAGARKEAVSKPGAVEKVKVTVNWGKVAAVSKTTRTLQVVVNPPMRRGSKIHDRVFQALHELGADYVRYVPWLPSPRWGWPNWSRPRTGRLPGTFL